MQDVLARVSTLTRPRLLAKAAQIGAKDYRRDLHLPRLLGQDALPRHADALLRLSEIEADMNTKRCERDSAYVLSRHVNILIAIAGEAALLSRSIATFQLKAT